jgi:hypothetical protein
MVTMVYRHQRFITIVALSQTSECPAFPSKADIGHWHTP